MKNEMPSLSFLDETRGEADHLESLCMVDLVLSGLLLEYCVCAVAFLGREGVASNAFYSVVFSQFLR